MDPRLATAVVRHACGERTLTTASTGPDEISVLGAVSDLKAWRARPEVRGGEAIADGGGGWLVTGHVALGDVVRVRSSPEVTSLKAARPRAPMLRTTIPDIQGGPATPAGLQGHGGGEGAIVAIIDQECDFAHRNFLD